jgi:asparagine synthase (glutamine-hydrolysing)
MCGFVGSYNKEENNKIPFSYKELKFIHHRGPDSQSIKLYKIFNKKKKSYSILRLGFKRLSIIDLSGKGVQPMQSSNNRYVIVFNGEIYNHLELKSLLISKGYKFRSKTDTEVLLNAWIEWGLESLKKINGMFAFSIFDKKEKKLILIRDPFGIKPLYYNVDNSSLNFCSELPLLLKLTAKKKLIDTQIVYNYLKNNYYDNSKNTFIKEINSLLPGHLIIFNLNNLKNSKQKKYWEPKIKQKKIKYSDAKKKLRSLLLENIKLNMRSDVKTCVLLSGGLDSTAIVCAMKHINPNQKINTFSYIPNLKKISEEKYIDIVNKHCNSKAFKIKKDIFKNYNEINNILLKQGEPYGGGSVHASYNIYKHIKTKKFKVALEGQGADEIFAGYDSFIGQRLLSLLEKRKFVTAFQFAKKCSETYQKSYLYAWKKMIILLHPNIAIRCIQIIFNLKFIFKKPFINKFFVKNNNININNNKYFLNPKYKGERVKEALINSIQSNNLPALLRHGDRNAMAHSVENRVPFLSIPIVEFMLSLPEEYLISNTGLGKKIFKDSLKDIMPDTILDRTDKIGFEVDEQKWLNKNKKKIIEIIKNFDDDEIIDKKVLLDKIKNISEQNITNNNIIWRCINFILWKKIVFDKFN